MSSVMCANAGVAAPVDETSLAECEPLRPLRKDIELLNDHTRRQDHLCWKLHDPLRNQFFSIGWLQFECLRRWSLGDADAIADSIVQETPLRVSKEDVLRLQEFLEQRELLQVQKRESLAVLHCNRQRATKSWWMQGFLATLYHRIPLLKPDPLLALLYRYLQPLLTVRSVVVFAVLALLAMQGVTTHWFEFSDQLSYYLTAEGMLGFVLVLLLVNLVHEFGHGLAAHHFGCRVPRMGIALVFLLPLFYSDVSDSWRLSSRKQRLWIGAAGMLAELLLAILACIAWLIVPDGIVKTLAYFLAVSSLAMTLLVNLNPFMKFDGYFLLSDALGVENMQERSFANLRWQIRRTVLLVDEPMPHTSFKQRHRILCYYALATWVYRLFLYLGISWMVYNFWFKALGIVMMAGVFSLMLLRPVYSEIKCWPQLLKSSPANPRRRKFAYFGLGICVLFLIPLPTNVVAPAVLSSANSAQVFSPSAAQLSSVAVREGELVSQGDVLFTLCDPELAFQQTSLQREIELLRYRLQQESRWGNQQGYQQVSIQELNSKRAALEAVNKGLERLVLRSPFDAEVSHLSPWLRPDTWLSANAVLAELSNPAVIEVRAYIEAVDARRIKLTGAEFRPLDGSESVSMKYSSLSNSTVHDLEDKLLSVELGGVIPTTSLASGEVNPREDWHKAIYQPIDTVDSSARGLAAREQAGYLLIPAQASSMAWRIVQRVYAILLRESGF